MKKKWRKRKRREKSERIKEFAPETIKEKCGDKTKVEKALYIKGFQTFDAVCGNKMATFLRE